MTTITAAAVRNAALAAQAEKDGFRLATTEEMKSWGKDNGFTIPEAQGRPATDLIEAFNKAVKRRKMVYVSGAAPEPGTRYEYTSKNGRKRVFVAPTGEVRAWAQGQEGLTVKGRGRLTQDVLDAYGQAHEKPAPKRKPKAAKVTDSE